MLTKFKTTANIEASVELTRVGAPISGQWSAVVRLRGYQVATGKVEGNTFVLESGRLPPSSADLVRLNNAIFSATSAAELRYWGAGTL